MIGFSAGMDADGSEAANGSFCSVSAVWDGCVSFPAFVLFILEQPQKQIRSIGIASRKKIFVFFIGLLLCLLSIVCLKNAKITL